MISSINSAALLILQQPGPVSESEKTKSGSDDLVAVANGGQTKVSVTKQPTQADALISQSIFSVNNVNITQLKLDLIERTGKALGVDEADYPLRADFVDAMQDALATLKRDEGDDAIMRLEKELGLDKLGLSLQDVIDSASDPESDDAVTKALAKQIASEAENSDPRRPDELGLYGIFNI